MARVIVVAGEALIDLLVGPDRRVAATRGGGPYNTARTIGRLGVAVAFLGRLSRDRFGRWLAEGLAEDGVDLRWAVMTDEPTTLAVAELDDEGVASYSFHLAGTSAPGLDKASIASVRAAGPAALHVGSLGLVARPIATTLAALVAGVSADTVVMVDPNCRPTAIHDHADYVQRLRGVVGRADIVKASVEDLEWLVPGAVAVETARELVTAGAGVVLLTDGASPVRVVDRTGSFEIAVPPIPPDEIVDTVGTGDAFGGAFLARWTAAGHGRRDVADRAAVVDCLATAIEVAGLTARRAGASPPALADLTGWPDPAAIG